MDRIITIIDDEGTRIETGADAGKVISNLEIIKTESQFISEVRRKTDEMLEMWR